MTDSECSKLISPFRLLNKHGIPGPVQIPFLGNYLEIKKKVAKYAC